AVVAADRAVAEIKFDFVRVVQLELRRKRPSEAAAKAFERSDPALAKKGLGFGRRELAPAHDLPEREIAGGTHALELAIFFVNLATALWTGRGQGREVARDRVALVVLRLSDDMPRHLDDLAHEVAARQLAVLHLRELELPLR